ncbi:TolC family protein [Shewanella intestini]|uniref:TolC family protein n=1 Tax=Shewanella intestini TaxID=2017544 RepID=A0ABS5I2Q6_9GAMM|nr:MULTISPECIES: TolC family protein [Shewanella]MBR9728306.1 TolC family protein [Shewanella intestini]MRG35771.1 hypothetical protein [Shewanella sp. XMDDZSB0408]
MIKNIIFIISMACYSSAYAQALSPIDNHPLSLSEVLNIAAKQDYQQQSISAQVTQIKSNATKAGALADPVVSLNLQNLPTDSMSLKQEAMTQLKLGFSQKFNAGDSLHYQKQQLLNQADSKQFSLGIREKQRQQNLKTLWLQLTNINKKISQTKQLLTKNHQLKKQMLTNLTVNKANQNVIFQIEIYSAQISNALTALKLQQSTAVSSLANWIGNAAYRPLALSYPDWTFKPQTHWNWTQQAQRLRAHPEIQQQQALLASAKDIVNIAKQKYHPQWALNVGYGHRQDASNNAPRSDTLSVGVSMSVPLFTSNRQDQGLLAAKSGVVMQRNQLQDALRGLTARWVQAQQAVELQQQQLQQYTQTILPTAQQATALIKQNYLTGNASYQQLIKSQMDLLNLNNQFSDAQAALYIALAHLQYFNIK